MPAWLEEERSGSDCSVCNPCSAGWHRHRSQLLNFRFEEDWRQHGLTVSQKRGVKTQYVTLRVLQSSHHPSSHGGFPWMIYPVPILQWIIKSKKWVCLCHVEEIAPNSLIWTPVESKAFLVCYFFLRTLDFIAQLPFSAVPYLFPRWEPLLVVAALYAARGNSLFFCPDYSWSSSPIVLCIRKFVPFFPLQSWSHKHTLRRTLWKNVDFQTLLRRVLLMPTRNT